MRGLACLIAVALVPVASFAEPPIVGSWIVHVDARQDREPAPASICLTFRPDGTFEIRLRRDARRKVFAGRYTLQRDRLRLETPGEEPVTEQVEVGKHRLRLVPGDGDLDQETGLIFERVAWCD